MKSARRQQKYSPYYDAVHYLEALGNMTGGYQKTNLTSHVRPEIFLERMQDFLDRLGNPEKDFKYIHITGTAGKGSVATLVHTTLVDAGKKAGLFTSPFCVSTLEKIQADKKYIDPLVFSSIVENLKPHIDYSILCGRHGAPSYFEMMLAIALLYFKKEKCQYVVLEVGLGGRYDATNIIKKPLITAITNISLDHTQILGRLRSNIAQDKAGIIKKNSAFFTTEENAKLLKIFKDECNKVGATYHALPVRSLNYASRNRLLAGSICMSLGIIQKLEDVHDLPKLPARFETIEQRPRVIIDGAHNPSKIESTVYNLRQIKYRKLILVLANSADKDWKSMMKLVAPLAHTIYITRFSVPGRQAVDPKLLFKEACIYRQEQGRVFLFSDPIQAFKTAHKKLTPKDVLLVTGSFYLAGDIRKLYWSEEDILKNRSSDINHN